MQFPPIIMLYSLIWLLGWACTVAGAGERIVLVTAGGEAKLQQPFGVDFDQSGDMFIVEMTGHRLRKFDRQGALTTVAGTGHKGDSGDGGAATHAEFNSMHNLAVARNGDIYLADTLNQRIRKIDA